jgi:hypothetical protein
MKESAKEILDRVLNTIQNQKDERLYNSVFIGRGYSKRKLIEDLTKIKEEIK